MIRPSNPALGIRFVLMATALFAVQDGTSKYLAGHYPPQFFIMIRYWLFAVFVTMLVARRPGGIRAAVHTRMPRLQVFRGVLLATQIIVMVVGFHRAGLAETQALFAMHPLLATLLAIPILGERIGWRRASAIAVGFLGVMVILRPGTGLMRLEMLFGPVAAVMMATYTVTTRLVSRADGSSMPAFFWLGVAGAAALTLVGPFYWTPMRLADWGWLMLHSTVAMAGHYCLIRALEATEAVRIQPFTYLQMVYAVPIGAFVFGEPVDAPMLAGMGIVIGAGLYAIWREYQIMRRSRYN
jgi:drug/metabolite transporter (DMT)-like permease